MVALVVTITIGTIIWITNRGVRNPPVDQIKEVKAVTAAAAPKTKDEEAKVTLVGITTILGQKKAFLRLRSPAGTPAGEQSFMLSEGQSQDGITVDNIDVTNGTVTLKTPQGTRIVKVEKGV